MTSQEPENPQIATPDSPDTEVISVPTPAPVFVDSTGRRSRLLRRLAYAFGAVVLLYGGLISVSLAGGPVRSSAVLPLPGLDDDEEDKKPIVKPTPAPVPSPSTKATDVFVADPLPRRTTSRPPAPREESTKVKPKPATAKPTPSTTPKPVVTTSRPTESTTTPPPSTPGTSSPPATTPSTPGPVPPGGPVAPAPPVSTSSAGTGSGGAGGGTGGETVDDIPQDDTTTPPETVAPSSRSTAGART